MGNDYRGSIVMSSMVAAAWKATAPLSTAVGELSEVPCPIVVFCMAVGLADEQHGVALMKSSTQSWTVLPVPAGQKPGFGCVCDSIALCCSRRTSFRSQSTVLMTSDSGASWAQSLLPH